MIKFNIPGMYECYMVNFKLLELMQKHPEYFYDDIMIESCYGNPQFCIWDGGRIFTNYTFADIDTISKIITTYNKYFNIPIRYVFTNPILQPQHFTDRFCNLLMQIGNNYHNEVVINSDILLDYLQEHYPNYRYVSSTTKCLLLPEQAKQELHNPKFDLICLDYNLNHNLKWLQQFTPEEKERTEFLVNAICPPNCQYRKDHYDLNGLSHLNYGKKYKMEGCNIKENCLHPDVRKNHLLYEDLHNTYAPLGFSHFKIEGRTWDKIQLSLTYCEYLVKPEWQAYVANILIQEK